MAFRRTYYGHIKVRTGFAERVWDMLMEERLHEARQGGRTEETLAELAPHAPSASEGKQTTPASLGIPARGESRG